MGQTSSLDSVDSSKLLAVFHGVTFNPDIPRDFIADKNGVGLFHTLGSKKGQYVNPVQKDLVSVEAHYENGNNRWLIGKPSRAKLKRILAMGPQFSQNRQEDPEDCDNDNILNCDGFTISLPMPFVMSQYSLRHGTSIPGLHMRHWVLEGSAGGGPWVKLRQHGSESGGSADNGVAPGDRTLRGGKHCWGSWKIDSGGRAYDRYRIRITGPTSSGINSVCCCGVEFFGEVVCAGRLPVGIKQKNTSSKAVKVLENLSLKERNTNRESMLQQVKTQTSSSSRPASPELHHI
eukprot:m.197027 g.197027  ORF g.197027 m.197027 type:complete len:290 (-) comp15706_c0_seq6:341-1210(-)